MLHLTVIIAMAISSPTIFKKLRKVPSFIYNHREIQEENEYMPSPSFKAKFFASEEQQFKQEWGRLQKAVFELYGSFKIKKINVKPFGTLAGLHDDVHVLIRSKAGTFVYDFLQKRILPAATQILFEDIVYEAQDKNLLEVPQNHLTPRLSKQNSKNTEANVRIRTLVKAWKHFYSHILPDLEMIFAQVKSQSQDTIRSAAIVAFRDGIVLELEPQLGDFLRERSKISHLIPSLKQMFLILQSVTEKYPPTENKLRLEALVALVISPYLGHHGLYENYSDTPVVQSNELSVAHLRRLSVADPRKLSRPLSMHSNKPLETLQDLFVLSADRTRHSHRMKSGSKEGRKRSVSTSEEFMMGNVGY